MHREYVGSTFVSLAADRVMTELLTELWQLKVCIKRNRQDLSKGSKCCRVLDITTFFDVFIRNFVPRYSKP